MKEGFIGIDLVMFYGSARLCLLYSIVFIVLLASFYCTVLCL